ncbi:MAG: phospho-sugar mutase, partial [Bacteroidales bacterium]|nr:phospho-sugar mutase [Bacteroidales bacterium]
NYDKETKEQVAHLIEKDPASLIDAFYKDLEFGTGGLRGIMGVGTNRMNKYTVGMATQGLANYLKKEFAGKNQIKAAIAYDNRNNSTFFAQVSANVLSANGIKVFLFDELRPTPELSFAIRYLNCQTGIVITASHNPKEYNGYKVYWEDGAQLIEPHDKNVIREVRNIQSVDEVKFDRNDELIEQVGKKIDNEYLKKVQGLSLSPDIIAKQNDLRIVYTPIHGTGVLLIPQALKSFGFTNIFNVPEQNIVSGDFPTVKSPNPEEPAALEMAIKKAGEVDAELVMATDPDADRVGIAVRDLHNKFVLLNGNQTAALLIYYLLTKWKNSKKFRGNEFIVKTIVTSELLKEIALSYQVEIFDVLTGFKYIADLINKLEGEKTFIGGGEESYGYLVDDFVRDKDAVISCCMVAEIAAWAKDQGKSLYTLLIEIYLKYGFYKESLISVVKKGKSGAEEIQRMMEGYRYNPLLLINNSPVIRIKDFLLQKEKNLKEESEKPIELPKSNVIQFYLEDGSKITVRPSGTEPKIKFYFSVKGELKRKEDFENKNALLDHQIIKIIESLGL